MNTPNLRGSVGGHVGTYRAIHTDFWDHEISLALINTPSWVVQGRFLSPRGLYFGDHQIFWECSHTHAGETHANVLPDEVDRSGKYNKSFSRIGHVEGDLDYAHDTWNGVVKICSVTQVPVTSEKLVALSAIVDFSEKVLGDEYIAGMWRRHLEYQLLSSIDDSQQATRPLEYRAPSWSWMAVNGMVIPGWPCQSEGSVLLCKVVGLELSYASDDRTGLQLQVPLKRMNFRRAESHRADSRAWVLTDSRFDTDNANSRYTVTFALRLDPLHTEADRRNACNELSFYCMPVMEEPEETVEMLILEVMDEEQGIYQRAGNCWVYGGIGEN